MLPYASVGIIRTTIESIDDEENGSEAFHFKTDKFFQVWLRPGGPGAFECLYYLR